MDPDCKTQPGTEHCAWGQIGTAICESPFQFVTLAMQFWMCNRAFIL